MFRQEEIEIILVDIADDQDVDEIVRGLSGHVLEAASYDEEREVVLPAEVFIELIEGIEALAEDHLQVGQDIAVEVQGVVLRVVFPPGFQDSEVLEVLEFAPDGIDLLIDVSAELADEEVFFGIEGMLQEEFLEEFFSAVRSEEFFEGKGHFQSAKFKMQNAK